ncbi:hypothetical protein DVH24_013300 [Malus domestica]|uniref:Myb-like domain-containing protein n=1 Tax=Malus domestica TaxID=3750 RepID=A0A498HJQ2_MALDO|nr:hypothetical protein DVH24_013300 [Malus domestica]
MVSPAMKDRFWTRKEDEAICRAYRWVSKDSVRGSSQTSEGVWTRVFKKYLNFYEGTTPLNIRNHESCSSRWKKHLHPTASRHENGANYYDEISHEAFWELIGFGFRRNSEVKREGGQITLMMGDPLRSCS